MNDRMRQVAWGLLTLALIAGGLFGVVIQLGQVPWTTIIIVAILEVGLLLYGYLRSARTAKQDLGWAILIKPREGEPFYVLFDDEASARKAFPDVIEWNIEEAWLAQIWLYGSGPRLMALAPDTATRNIID